jgi:hypothetical protein
VERKKFESSPDKEDMISPFPYLCDGKKNDHEFDGWTETGGICAFSLLGWGLSVGFSPVLSAMLSCYHDDDD